MLRPNQRRMEWVRGSLEQVSYLSTTHEVICDTLHIQQAELLHIEAMNTSSVFTILVGLLISSWFIVLVVTGLLH